MRTELNMTLKLSYHTKEIDDVNTIHFTLQNNTGNDFIDNISYISETSEESYFDPWIGYREDARENLKKVWDYFENATNGIRSFAFVGTENITTFVSELVFSHTLYLSVQTDDDGNKTYTKQSLGDYLQKYKETTPINSVTFTKNEIVNKMMETGTFTYLVVSDGIKFKLQLDKLRDYIAEYFREIIQNETGVDYTIKDVVSMMEYLIDELTITPSDLISHINTYIADNDKDPTAEDITEAIYNSGKIVKGIIKSSDGKDIFIAKGNYCLINDKSIRAYLYEYSEFEGQYLADLVLEDLLPVPNEACTLENLNIVSLPKKATIYESLVTPRSTWGGTTREREERYCFTIDSEHGYIHNYRRTIYKGSNRYACSVYHKGYAEDGRLVKVCAEWWARSVAEADGDRSKLTCEWEFEYYDTETYENQRY
jgi:hypothetical protein